MIKLIGYTVPKTLTSAWVHGSLPVYDDAPSRSWRGRLTYLPPKLPIIPGAKMAIAITTSIWCLLVTVCAQLAGREGDGATFQDPMTLYIPKEEGAHRRGTATPFAGTRRTLRFRHLVSPLREKGTFSRALPRCEAQMWLPSA